MDAKEIRLRAWFPKSRRIIHFSHPEMDDEYDGLTFYIEEKDATETYQWLAGKCHIPNEPFELEVE